MEDILINLSRCIELGKINRDSPYPPQLRGHDGASELAMQAIENGIPPDEILNKALIAGMEKVGESFRENRIYVPQVLIAAKAMEAAMVHLKPFFLSGVMKPKGTFIIGTVLGDLHDIGKNIVAMMVEGNGYNVIDLGTDAGPEKFIEVLDDHPGASVGLSALLTTTMVNMETTTYEIKKRYPATAVCIGGAPVNQEFCNKIGADLYSPDPQNLVQYLKIRASDCINS